MCGVIGCVAWQNPERLPEIIANMQGVQRHRGPDQQAEWIGSRVGIGGARLSILDLSDVASQPMATSDNRYIITYNGELYNYCELRSRMEKKGIRFRTRSDTEVVLMALSTFGDEILPEFDGMFAFAFVDVVANKLLLARDRVGIKPLHYYADDRVFLFASEIKSIWAALEKTGLEPDPLGLRDVFSLGYGYGAVTPFRGVKTLQSGEQLSVDIDSKKILNKSYFDLLSGLNEKNWQEQNLRSAEAVEQDLEKAIVRSVNSHLISDAPVGIICSGGVDSSLIAALARRVTQDLEIYHAEIPGPLGELTHVRKVATHLSMPLNVASVNRDTFLRHWPLAIYHNDLPSYHPNDVPLYAVCKLAREQGVKVLLSGEGADELFGGYSVYLELQRRSRWQRIMSLAPAVLRKFFRSIAEAQVFIGGANEKMRWLANTCGMGSLGRIERFILTELLFQGHAGRMRRGLNLMDRLSFLTEHEKVVTSYCLERIYGHLGSLLFRNDRMGMMASVETRIPYLSNELLRTWLPMPLKFKICKGGHLGLKYLLKQIASRYLPKDICFRPKRGFPVPLQNFIQPNPEIFAKGFLEKCLDLPLGTISEFSQDVELFYRMASIEMWGRIFFLKESPEALSEWVMDNC